MKTKAGPRKGPLFLSRSYFELSLPSGGVDCADAGSAAALPVVVGADVAAGALDGAAAVEVSAGALEAAGVATSAGALDC
jgi:hypothetical protein